MATRQRPLDGVFMPRAQRIPPLRGTARTSASHAEAAPLSSVASFTQEDRQMNIGLWVVQVLLALAFGAAGLMKTTRPIAELAQSMVWPADIPAWLVRVIGTAELLAAIGLLLPAATRIKPVLNTRGRVRTGHGHAAGVGLPYGPGRVLRATNQSRLGRARRVCRVGTLAYARRSSRDPQRRREQSSLRERDASGCAYCLMNFCVRRPPPPSETYRLPFESTAIVCTPMNCPAP